MATRRVMFGIVALALSMAACGSDDDSAPPNSVAPTDPAATDPASSTPGSSPGSPEGSAVAVYEQGDIDEGLRPFIDQAIADLAGRTGVAADDIEVWSAVLVTWPDASLGCPEPDHQYAQVTTDGSVIELSIDGVIHRYHTGGSQTPFLCDQPLDRKPPASG